MLFLNSTVSAWAQTPAIDSLMKDIMGNEIKMAKFNLHFRLEATKQGRWKGLRYFLFQESNAALTEASLIVGGSERLSHISGKNYKHLNQTTLKAGNIIGALGQGIGATGSAIELGINNYHQIRASGAGFSPGKAAESEAALVKTIDAQLDQLRLMVKSEHDRTGEVHSIEALILKDIRDLLVIEFEGFHSGATRTFWEQQSFYTLDIARNIVGATGNIYGYKSLRQHNRNFNKPAGVLVTVSGALLMAAPILSKIAGAAACRLDLQQFSKFNLSKMANRLSNLQENMLSLDAALDAMSDSGEPMIPATDRVVHYYAHTNRFIQQLESSLAEQQTSMKTTVQNVLSGLFVGGTKLSNGIMFTKAGYSYNADPRRTNTLLGTGAIPFLTGNSYTLVKNVRTQVKAEVKRKKLKQERELPAQLLNAQLEDLTGLERSFDILE